MCHSLIGWEEAQSMCSPLSQSEPSFSLPPSFHLDRRSCKPSAYKSNPLPSHIITIIQSNNIMPFWSQIHTFPSTSKPIKNPKSISSIEAFGSYWAYIPNLQIDSPLHQVIILIERADPWLIFSFEDDHFVSHEDYVLFVLWMLSLLNIVFLASRIWH